MQLMLQASRRGLRACPGKCQQGAIEGSIAGQRPEHGRWLGSPCSSSMATIWIPEVSVTHSFCMPLPQPREGLLGHSSAPAKTMSRKRTAESEPRIQCN